MLTMNKKKKSEKVFFTPKTESNGWSVVRKWFCLLNGNFYRASYSVSIIGNMTHKGRKENIFWWLNTRDRRFSFQVLKYEKLGWKNVERDQKFRSILPLLFINASNPLGLSNLTIIIDFFHHTIQVTQRNFSTIHNTWDSSLWSFHDSPIFPPYLNMLSLVYHMLEFLIVCLLWNWIYRFVSVSIWKCYLYSWGRSSS